MNENKENADTQPITENKQSGVNSTENIGKIKELFAKVNSGTITHLKEMEKVAEHEMIVWMMAETSDNIQVAVTHFFLLFLTDDAAKQLFEELETLFSTIPRDEFRDLVESSFLSDKEISGE